MVFSSVPVSHGTGAEHKRWSVPDNPEKVVADTSRMECGVRLSMSSYQKQKKFVISNREKQKGIPEILCR